MLSLGRWPGQASSPNYESAAKRDVARLVMSVHARGPRASFGRVSCSRCRCHADTSRSTKQARLRFVMGLGGGDGCGGRPSQARRAGRVVEVRQAGGGDWRTRGIKLKIGGAEVSGSRPEPEGRRGGAEASIRMALSHGTLPGVAWQDMHRPT